MIFQLCVAASQSTEVNSAGILRVQPPPSITAPVPHLTMPGRMTGMSFLDIRPALLAQPTAARFALLTPAMPPPPRSMLPPHIDPTVHSLPFPSGDVFPRPSVPSSLHADSTVAQEGNVLLPHNNLQQERDQDYRFPPVENVNLPSGGKPNKQTMPPLVGQENKDMNPTEEIDIKVRHIEDDHEPQDMSVVDPCEGQEKDLESDAGLMSVEVPHDTEGKIEPQSLDGVRESDLHSYESKLRNTPDSHDSELKRPLETRQKFVNSPLDLLPPFGRHSLEMREMYTRPPPEERDHFGRPILEGHHGRPPIDTKDHYGRLVPEGRNHFGRSPVDGREHFGRPPLNIRDYIGSLISDGGRREQLHFHPDKPWGHRGDFDERQLYSFPGFGGPKGFQDERHRHSNYRHEPRNAPGWNRAFEPDPNRDFDDRRRPWERHRDRDDRDFGFRREMNGNRFGREMQASGWTLPQPQIFEYFPEASATNQKENDMPQVNGDTIETGNQTQTMKNVNDSELSEQESSDKVNEEKDARNAEVESQPVVESTETEGT